MRFFWGGGGDRVVSVRFFFPFNIILFSIFNFCLFVLGPPPFFFIPLRQFHALPCPDLSRLVVLLPINAFSNCLLETCWVFISVNGRLIEKLLAETKKKALRDLGRWFSGEKACYASMKN